MAHGVYYVARGLVLNLSLPDLGHPGMPWLWDEIYPASKLPPNQLQCLQCLEQQPDCPEYMYLRVRDGRREAVHHNTSIRGHGAGESDAHKALKERTAATAERAGFSVIVEQRPAHGGRQTDVLVRGADGFQLGVEAQVSYITTEKVSKRTAVAQRDGITPMWVVNYENARPIHRAPWCRVPNADWRQYLRPNLMALGGVRNLAWESCDDLVRRGEPCPVNKRRKSCGNWHHSWEPRQVPYDELVVKAAAQVYVPFEIQRGNRRLFFWVPAKDRETFRDAEAEEVQRAKRKKRPPEPKPVDPRCTYGSTTGFRPEPRVPRDDTRPVAVAPRPRTGMNPELRRLLRERPNWPICVCGWPLDPAAGDTHPGCARAAGGTR